MKISEKGLALIQRFEGCSLTAYQDRVGVWTIGYGTTNADYSITGRYIGKGLVISKATAERWLSKALEQKYVPRVTQYQTIYGWNQNELDALVSFCYNLGSIDKLTNNGKRSRAEIMAAWPLYCKAGGKPVKGLSERREAELKLFRAPVKDGEESTTEERNPYPAPKGTVTSTEQAAARGIQKWIPQGEQVCAVQWELRRLGYDLGSAGVDGICGARTVAAVEDFQRSAGLTVDGLCGLKTWAALTAARDKPVISPLRPSGAPPLSGEARTKLNYRSCVAAKAEKIYPMCVGKRHGKSVQKRVKTLEQFKGHKELNCHLLVSLVLQEADLLPKGCVITHTPKGGSKRKITDAVRGTNKLRHCKVYWVNKRYKDLPERWKRAGVVYIQDSNACISAGGGKIWSCNKSVGERYKVRGDYLRSGGYPFTSKILCVIVPEEA